MKKEIKTKWVEALRSGKYKQGTGCLGIKAASSEFQYCCIGVLCEIEGLLKVHALGQNIFVEEKYLPSRYKTTTSMTKHYLKKFGLTHKQQAELIVLNDDRCKNFNEIADFIEEKL